MIIVPARSNEPIQAPSKHFKQSFSGLRNTGFINPDALRITHTRHASAPDVTMIDSDDTNNLCLWDSAPLDTRFDLIGDGFEFYQQDPRLEWDADFQHGMPSTCHVFPWNYPPYPNDYVPGAENVWDISHVAYNSLDGSIGRPNREQAAQC